MNPTTGCDGCELWFAGKGGPCYAGNLHEGRLANSLPTLYAQKFHEVRLAPGRMAKAAAWPDLTGKGRPGKPWLDGMPRTIFVGDMADIFSKDVPFDYLKSEVIDVATSKQGRRHVWQLLTKQPARMAEFDRWLESQGIDWPDNVWAGTSVTSAKSVQRIDHLLKVRTPVPFVSLEPLISYVDIDGYLDAGYESGGPEGWVSLPSVAWMIIGGESKQGDYITRGFDVSWARLLITDAHINHCNVFIKQLGSLPYDGQDRISIDGRDSHAVQLNLKDGHGGDWDEWPADLRVREMPGVARA